MSGSRRAPLPGVLTLLILSCGPSATASTCTLDAFRGRWAAMDDGRDRLEVTDAAVTVRTVGAATRLGGAGGALRAQEATGDALRADYTVAGRAFPEEMGRFGARTTYCVLPLATSGVRAALVADASRGAEISMVEESRADPPMIRRFVRQRGTDVPRR